MPGRSQTPLFDLLSRGGSIKTPDGEVPADHVPAGIERESNAATVGGRSGLVVAGGRMSMPVTWAYGLVTGVVVVFLVAFVAGFQVGDRNGRDAGRSGVRAGAVGITPVEPDGMGGVGIGGAGDDGGRETPVVGVGGDDLDVVTPLWEKVLVAGGETAEDPRKSGWNYLELATLPREAAINTLDFLASEGLDAIAVPIGSSVVTSQRFTLVSLGLEVPSERYRAMASERSGHVEEIEALGKKWSMLSGGVANFSKWQWDKHR